MKQCFYCMRKGTRGFQIAYHDSKGGVKWFICSNTNACAKRIAKWAKKTPMLLVTQPDDLIGIECVFVFKKNGKTAERQ